MAVPARFIPSKRGGQLLVLPDNFVFRINNTVNDTKYWRCVKECSATAVTRQLNVVSSKGIHNHPPDAGFIQEKVAIAEAKTDAVNQPLKSMKRVYSEAFQVQPNEENFDPLPSFTKHKHSLYRARAHRLPRIPHSRAAIALDGQWTQTIDGRNFVLANDGVEDRLIIFGTTQNLRFLCAADTVYMDGTFKMAPAMFLQIFSIHVKVMDVMRPVCIALLPYKNEATYTRFLNLLRTAAGQHGHQFNPPIVCIDFESAMITSDQQIYPNARIRGCLFHYSQAIWRHVQLLGLTVRYNDDAEFNRVVRRATALPLLPPDRVDEVWLEAINEVAEPDAAAQQFMDYVTTTWVDNMVARFPIEIWTQFDNISGTRTNNHLESWHSTLNRQMNRPHPNVFALIETLQLEQQRVEQNHRLLQAGGEKPKQRLTYQRTTERLIRLRDRLLNNDIDAYQYAGAVAGALKQGVRN